MQQRTINSKEYKDSLFFTFGVVDNTIDVFNNPYFKIKAYKYKSQRIREEIPLQKCSNKMEEMLPGSSTYLNNTICLNDTIDVKINSNILDVRSFEGIFIAIEEC